MSVECRLTVVDCWCRVPLHEMGVRQGQEDGEVGVGCWLRGTREVAAMKRVWIGAIVVLASLAMSTVVGLSEPQYGGSLRIALQVEPYTFDPNYYKSMVDLMVDRLMYETLVTFNAEAQLIPELATRWERVDNLTWRFWLRGRALS